MPLWLSALCLMLLMTATNLFSVSSFGEFEFWFAGIKVATIVVFLVVGTLFALGALPGHQTDFSNLTSHGGFFPKGVGAVFAAIVVVIFSMVGAEVVTIAAAESSDPERAIQRATRSVVARIAIFFVGSVFLLVVILPWNSVELGLLALRRRAQTHGTTRRGSGDECGGAHRGAVLSELGPVHLVADAVRARRSTRGAGAAGETEPAGGALRRDLVLVGGGFRLRHHGVALAAHGVPFPAQLVGRHHLVRLLADRFVADRVAPPHIEEKLRVKMWFFPVLSILTLVGITAVLVQMAFDHSARSQLWLSLLSWAVVIGLYFGARARPAK